MAIITEPVFGLPYPDGSESPSPISIQNLAVAIGAKLPRIKAIGINTDDIGPTLPNSTTALSDGFVNINNYNRNNFGTNIASFQNSGYTINVTGVYLINLYQAWVGALDPGSTIVSRTQVRRNVAWGSVSGGALMTSGTLVAEAIASGARTYQPGTYPVLVGQTILASLNAGDTLSTLSQIGRGMGVRAEGGHFDVMQLL